MVTPFTQAVILAAGTGKRLAEVSGGNPKCLQEVGGSTLLALQIENLRRLEICSIVVVVGFAQDRVRNAVSGMPGVTCVSNPIYASTNSLYSLWLARDEITGPFMLVNGDVFAHQEVYRRVAAVQGSAVSIDSASGGEAEQMKVRLKGSYVETMSKDLRHPVNGENVGILQFDAQARELLFAAADELISTGCRNEWAPSAVDRIVDRVRIRAVDVHGLPWTEIDFPEDLERARAEIAPRILGVRINGNHSSAESLERFVR